MAKNYYIILGIESDASQDEIKAAYRRKAKNLHPDHFGKDCEPFLDVQEAYSILSDPQKRKAYDKRLWQKHIPRKGAPIEPEPIRPRRAPIEPLIPQQDIRDIYFDRSFDTFQPSYEEIFERLWSNFFSTSHLKAERPARLAIEIPLSEGQTQRGGRLRIIIPVLARCPLCGGVGHVGFCDCMHCDGKGLLHSNYPLLVTYPAGLTSDYEISYALDHLGIDNYFLTLIFKISEYL